MQMCGEQTLIRGGHVMTLDPELGDLPEADILIEDSEIVDIAPGLHAQIRRGVNVIDAAGKVVMPGLVDNHWHMWQGLVPGISADHTFGEYFAGPLDAIGPKFRPRDAALGVRLSALAGLNAGTTTALNWDHGALSPEHAIANIRALQTVGMRAIEAYGPPANSAGWFNSRGGPIDADVRSVFEEYIKPDSLVGFGLAIRGPEFSDMERVRADIALVRELNIRATTHAGIPGFFSTKNSPELMEGADLLGEDITFVHCNAMGVPDFERIHKYGAHVSGSPEVEMQMGFGRSPLGAMIEGGLNPTVSLDVPTAVGAGLLLQARMLLQRQREADNDAALASTGQPLPSLLRKDADVLPYITRNAAASMGLADKIGSLTIGKQADVILVDISGPDNFLRPPHSALVQSVHPGNITDVFVAGRAMKRNGRLVCIEEGEWRELKKEAKAARLRLGV